MIIWEIVILRECETLINEGTDKPKYHAFQPLQS
jgi:hypothetical protein